MWEGWGWVEGLDEGRTTNMLHVYVLYTDWTDWEKESETASEREREKEMGFNIGDMILDFGEHIYDSVQHK